MPRAPRYAVTWSAAAGLYALQGEGHEGWRFPPGDEAAWQAWLGDATGFAFHGVAGNLNCYREARPPGGRYWYAYHTAGGRTRKRYLGAPATVTLARLEAVAASLAGEPTHPTDTIAPPTSPATDWPGILPTTKLTPPQSPGALVRREHLLDALDAALASPLTLVAAPAGWGKTTALATWARRSPDRVAWLALDATDDDPARFWSAVVAALQARTPGIGTTVLALLRSQQPPPLPVIVTALVNELAGQSGAVPLVLVLDDYHAIANAGIHESMMFLLDHLPVGLRLIIASRADPDLPLARLRARAQLAELRAGDLRFSDDDAAAMVRQVLGTPLAPEGVAALARRTEGWATGLQLAALALRRQEDRTAWLARFTGSHRYILDYVEEEILASQPPAIRLFLLRAAVLGRLGADLCAAVTGEATSGAILADLARANLFVVPLDEEGRWYRLHDLFREALLTLAANEPGLLAEAHGRAARWYADGEHGHEAIGHALDAGAWPLAADLIAREAPRLWRAGEGRTVLGWLRALPEADLLRHARLALEAALRLTVALNGVVTVAAADARRELEQLLARVEAGLGTGAAVADAEAALLRRRLRLLRLWAEAQLILPRGDAVALSPLAEEGQRLAVGEVARWRVCGLALSFWLAVPLRRDGRALLPQLVALRAQARAEGEHQAELSVAVWLAYIYRDTGQLRELERAGRAGVALAERLEMRGTSVGYLHIFLSGAYYAWDRLAEANDATHALLAIARTWQQWDLLLVGNLLTVDFALARGDLASADRAQREAEEVIQRSQFTTSVSDVAASRARYWLAAGDPDRAERAVLPSALDVHTAAVKRRPAILALIAVQIARHQFAEAATTLRQFGDLLEQPGDIHATIKFFVLSVITLHATGEDARARAVAARLLALTEPEGWLRPYLDGGAPMERALMALIAAPDDVASAIPVPQRAYIARLLDAFAAERRGRRDAAPAILPPPAPGNDALVEPLTRREREVLRLLADGATNQEIADATAVALTTAKKHVGNLLGKLGVANRTQAVARARILQLL